MTEDLTRRPHEPILSLDVELMKKIICTCFQHTKQFDKIQLARLSHTYANKTYEWWHCRVLCQK